MATRLMHVRKALHEKHESALLVGRVFSMSVYEKLRCRVGAEQTAAAACLSGPGSSLRTSGLATCADKMSAAVVAAGRSALTYLHAVPNAAANVQHQERSHTALVMLPDVLLQVKASSKHVQWQDTAFCAHLLKSRPYRNMLFVTQPQPRLVHLVLVLYARHISHDVPLIAC
jgi:hypothetical protein